MSAININKNNFQNEVLNSDMAVFLGVSKTALSIRLTQLGLVDKNYFGNPYDLTDIYCDGGIRIGKV